MLRLTSLKTTHFFNYNNISYVFSFFQSFNSSNFNGQVENVSGAAAGGGNGPSGGGYVNSDMPALMSK